MNDVFAPVGFGVSYLVFPLLFFIFFVMVGVTAVVTHLRARRGQMPALPVERMVAVVRQKQVVLGVRRRYRAVFSLETGGEAVFFLTRAQYGALSAGLRGALVHRGKRFLCFDTNLQ